MGETGAAAQRYPRITVEPFLHKALADRDGPFKQHFLALKLRLYPGDDDLIMTLDGPVSPGVYEEEVPRGMVWSAMGAPAEPLAFEAILTSFVLDVELHELEIEGEADLAFSRDLTDAILRDFEIERELALERRKPSASISPEVGVSTTGPAAKVGLTLPVRAEHSSGETFRYKTTGGTLSFDAYVAPSARGRIWTFVSQIGERQQALDAFDDRGVDIEGLIGSFQDAVLARLLVAGARPRIRAKVMPHRTRRSIRLRRDTTARPSFMSEERVEAFRRKLEDVLTRRFRKDGFMTLEWEEDWSAVRAGNAAEERPTGPDRDGPEPGDDASPASGGAA